MGHIRDPSYISGSVGVGNASNATEELQSNPKSNHDDCWHGDNLWAEQDVHALLGEHQDVGTEHAGNRTRGPKVW